MTDHSDTFSGGPTSALRIDRARILQLIPHQYGMCLLDSVVRWDAQVIHASTLSHQLVDNPLRREHQLSALHLCEYGAQAMAVHGGLRASAQGGRARPGLLVSLRGVELYVSRIDDLTHALDVHAEVLMESEASWQYRFWVEHAGTLLAEGRAAVMLAAEEGA